jgi:hypothetical protein
LAIDLLFDRNGNPSSIISLSIKHRTSSAGADIRIGSMDTILGSLLESCANDNCKSSVTVDET